MEGAGYYPLSVNLFELPTRAALYTFRESSHTCTHRRCYKLPPSLFPSFTVWIFLLLIEEGFALVQQTKGKIDVFTDTWRFFCAFSPAAASHVSVVTIWWSAISSHFRGSRIHPDEGAGAKGVKPSQRPQRPLHCGNWARNADGGSFSSPNYPRTYPPNKECLYVLEGNQQHNQRASSNYYDRCTFWSYIRHIVFLWGQLWDPVEETTRILKNCCNVFFHIFFVELTFG